MTEEELKALRNAATVTPEQVDDYNNTLRQWRAKCPYCLYIRHGTLNEIRAFFHTCDRLCKHGPQAK